MKSLGELFATAWISATWKKFSPSLDFAGCLPSPSDVLGLHQKSFHGTNTLGAV